MPYRIGIIGLGRVAYQLEQDLKRNRPCTHAGAWLAQPGAVLVAGCDIDAGQRQLFRAQYPDASVYADYREMLEKENLDFVSICAYADTRSEMVVNAANAGVKGIWCEKALATSMGEARRMQTALSRNGTKMIISFMRRWHPRYLMVKEMLIKKEIGDLQTINVHFSGNIMHTGTHAYDVLNMLAGNITGAQAWLRQDEKKQVQERRKPAQHLSVDDCGGFALLELENGVKAAVHGDNKNYFRFELELTGSDGMIRIGNTQQQVFVTGDADYSSDLKDLKETDFPDYENISHWQRAASDLVRATEQDTEPACGIAQGMNSLAAGLAIHYSHGKKNNQQVMLEEVPDELKIISY